MFGELRNRDAMVSNHSTWPHAARVAPQAGERRPDTGSDPVQFLRVRRGALADFCASWIIGTEY